MYDVAGSVMVGNGCAIACPGVMCGLCPTFCGILWLRCSGRTAGAGKHPAGYLMCTRPTPTSHTCPKCYPISKAYRRSRRSRTTPCQLRRPSWLPPSPPARLHDPVKPDHGTDRQDAYRGAPTTSALIRTPNARHQAEHTSAINAPLERRTRMAAGVICMHLHIISRRLRGKRRTYTVRTARTALPA